MKSGEEVEDLILDIAHKVLKIPLYVWLLDPRPSVGFMCLNFGRKQKRPVNDLATLGSKDGIHLLLRPGHFDIVYSEQYDVRKLKSYC